MKASQETALLRTQEEVFAYECDPSDNIKLGYLLRKIEESSDKHYQMHGYDFKYMKEKQQIYLLNNLLIKNEKMPKVGEKFFIETWEEGVKGATFIRNFVCRDEDNKPFSICKSVWILADSQTHKIIRPANSAYETYFIDRSIDIQTFKIKKQKNAKSITNYKVMYKDLDRYNHMNNTIYCDIVESVTDFDYFKTFPRELNIYFKNEVKVGETINIVGCDYFDSDNKQENQQRYFVGGIKENGTVSFESTIIYG